MQTHWIGQLIAEFPNHFMDFVTVLLMMHEKELCTAVRMISCTGSHALQL